MKPKKIRMASTKRRPKRKTGPKPDVLKVEGDWQEAIKKSLAKKKPEDGWPKL